MISRRGFFSRAIASTCGIALAQRIALEPVAKEIQFTGGITGALEGITGQGSAQIDNQFYNWWEREPRITAEEYERLMRRLFKEANEIEWKYLMGEREG